MSMFFAQIVGLFILPILLAYACFSDLFTMKISNKLSISVIGLFLVYAIAVVMPLPTIAWHLVAGLSVLVVSFALFAFGWIGGGDAKFVAAASVWFGFGMLGDYLAISAVLGGVLTVGLLFIRKYPLPASLLNIPWIDRLHNERTGVPYGIALGSAAMLLLPMSAAVQFIM